MTDQNSPDHRAFRSLLFAPGSDEAVLRKLPRASPDGAVLDLEDAVAIDAKASAREIVHRVAVDLAAEVDVLVRVNAPDSAFFVDDLAALSASLTAVVVPKLQSSADVEAVARALDRAGFDRLPIVAGIETAFGVHAIDDVLADDRVTAAYFGAEDFIADVGGVRTSTNHEVTYARGRCALAASVAGVALLDQVVADFGDEERFVREATEARNMGYAGKLCIHPAQVALAHAAFSATADEVDHARRLIAAYEESGLGVVSFEGQMVDEPVVVRARKVVASADTN